LSRLDGLLVGENPARGIFTDNRFMHPVLDFTLRFPPKWKTMNTPQMVIGQAPQEDAMISVQVVGSGDDPRTVVKALEEKMRVNLLENAESTRIHGLPAIRNRVTLDGSSGTVGLDMTWIAHHSTVYQIVGLSPVKQFIGYQDIFMETAKSFSPLSNEDMAGIKESLIRIFQARRGETLEALISRGGGVWTQAETAVANGLPEGTPLREGQLIKIAVPQPYRGTKGP
jgi:predicted Zn-dependent protease